MFESLLTVIVSGLLAADVAAYRSRRRLFRGATAFQCRIRTCGYTSPSWPRLHRRWSRLMWAAWAGDVLLVWRGPLFARAMPLRASIAAGGIDTLTPEEVRWCGSRPVVVHLHVVDGSRIEVAASEQARLALVGPYLVAAVDDHRRPPDSRRRV